MTRKEIERIINKARKEKFGRSNDQQYAKRLFVHGVMYGLAHIAGNEAYFDQDCYYIEEGA